MAKKFCIALVGRPNVGKSRLFNRLARSRLSIVHGQPGVTRDVVSADLPNGATLLDTGGLCLCGGETPDELVEAVENQVSMALAMADLLVFVVDGRSGPLPQDLEIAAKLRKTGKRIVLAINKIDNEAMDATVDSWSPLGFGGSQVAISAEHGRAIGSLESRIYADMQAVATEPDSERPTTLAIVGAPNVGKSSIANCLLGGNRSIVSAVAGTTRDTIHGDFTYSKGGSDHPMRLLDTAGLRAIKKISSPVEFFSSRRAHGAIEEADVVFLVLDAARGLSSFDKSIAASVMEKKKCLAIAVNKWDLALDAVSRDTLPQYEDIGTFREEFERALRKELFQWPAIPIIFLSAKSGLAVDGICASAIDLRERSAVKIGTGQLNSFMAELCGDGIQNHGGGKSFKIFYALQTSTSPTALRIYCNDERLLHGTQLTRLRNRLVERFHLGGCPLSLDFVSKPKRNSKKH
ncbi:MAG: ribosome biogenesis GTPase Der [Puniceicoccales bacterium]|jgi:GTP-binding protein|nr:ribosome biogenesis GTPase Der [Puniceicoccales bacterium]